MRWTRLLIAMACCLSTLMVGAAHAASSLNAPLTSFDGANFTTANPIPDHAVVWDASGAHFGTVSAGDDGRNFQRTIVNDYATVPFFAEITFELISSPFTNDAGTPDDPLDDYPDDLGNYQAVFFGLGAGAYAIFGTPDWDTANSSASFWPDTGADKWLQFTNKESGVQTFFDYYFSPYDPGTHRFRMQFDPTANRLTGLLDLNYAGGPFVADVIGSPSIDTSSLFAVDGWPSDPSRIWFGGDDGAIFRDLRIVVGVVPEPATWMLLLLGIATLARGRLRGKP